MADYRIVNLQTLLNTLNSMRESHLTSQAFVGNLSEQKQKLEKEKFTLTQELLDIDTAISTYDREFHDRRSSPPPSRVTTTQDWVLMVFFITYTAMMFAFLYYILFNTKISLLFFTMIFALFLGISVGIFTILQSYA